jgi:plasmid stabilization system protein ParE
VDHRVLFTERALNDLAGIIGRIAKDDPEAASRFGTALLDHIDMLGRFPRMGAPIRKRARVRKLVHSPILIYYKFHEDRGLVEVLHLRHGSRRPARP